MKRRPGWVWLITVYYGMSVCWTAISFYLIFTETIPLTATQKWYFQNLTLLDWVATVAIGVLNLAAVTLLFTLHRQAVVLFGTGITLGVLITVWHVLTKGFLAALPAGGLLGWLIGMAIQVSVFLYSLHLSKVGLLT